MKNAIKAYVAMIVLALMCILGNIIFSIKISEVKADNTHIISTQPQVSLDEDFEDDKVIVTLKSEYSEINQYINLEDFNTQNVFTMSRMNEKTSKNLFISQESNLEDKIVIESVEDLTYIESPSQFQNKNEFSQILSIKLSEHNKSNVLRAIDEFSKLDWVETAEPSYIFESVDDWMPNDPYYSSQWGLNGINGINVENAWDELKGVATPTLKVGIFERNIKNNHEDLLVAEGNFVPSNNESAEHGIHVAGIIAALSNNGIGISGVAQVEIVLLNRNNFVESITWAINNGVKVINASFYYKSGNELAGPVESHVNAIKLFGANGGILITSAGNNGRTSLGNTDTNPQFPAGYADARYYPDINNVLSVGSINEDGEKSSFSNYGKNSVSIYAPGNEILSTYPSEICASVCCMSDSELTEDELNQKRNHFNDGYHFMSGTSMAAPYVTGVVALLRADHPSLSANDIKDLILDNSDNVSMQFPDGSEYSVKQLNADNIVNAYIDSYHFQLTIDYQCNIENSEIPVLYKNIVDIANNDVNLYIDNRTGYDFQGIYSEPNGEGIQYFGYEIVKPASEYVYKLVSTGETWDQQSDGMVYAYWTLIGGTYEYSINVSNADEQLKRTISLTHGTNVTITAPSIDGYTFESMWVNGTTYTTSTVQLNNVQLRRNLGYEFLGNVIGNEPFHIWYMPYGATTNQGGLHMTYKKNECVAAGTLITLADGSQVPVETLTGNERLLVWNLHTGRFDTAPILFIDHDSAQVYKIINLYFSDGTRVKVISEHAFWDFDLNKYVFLREDAAQYLGHWFNKQTTDAMGNMVWTRVQLTSVTITEEYTTAWSPVTYGHLCIYVNGMLSMPGATSGLINIFEVDGETMQINQEQYLADIATYGLFTYEEFAELYPIPEEMFNAVNGQYLKVSIGKRLIDYETLGILIETYSHFFE